MTVLSETTFELIRDWCASRPGWTLGDRKFGFAQVKELTFQPDRTITVRGQDVTEIVYYAWIEARTIAKAIELAHRFGIQVT